VAELLVIVPSRGRPESLGRVAEAWRATGALDDGARLMFAVDDDDPMLPRYRGAWVMAPWVHLMAFGPWQPMVSKLNAVAGAVAAEGYFAVGFAGDDHLPRTPGWVGAYLGALRELGTGIVYGDDGIQGRRLPTQWAMTSDIVRALGRMVPAPVDHLYCDNAVKDLGEQAGCLRYLPDVLIEHMHPVVGKAPVDAGYARVNRAAQYRKDRAAYEAWARVDLAVAAGVVRTMRERARSI
jgi:hypothetical protein